MQRAASTAVGGEPGSGRLRESHKTRLLFGALGIAGLAAAIFFLTAGSGSRPTRTPPAAILRAGYVVEDPATRAWWSVRAVGGAGGASCAEAGWIPMNPLRGAPPVLPQERRATAKICLGRTVQPLRAVSRTLRTRLGTRTVLYGIAAPQVRMLRLRRGGHSRPITRGRGGVFLLVAAGAHQFAGATVVGHSQTGPIRVHLRG